MMSCGADAEVLDRRFALLTRANKIMASSPDYEASLREVASLAVPEFADWCAVYLLGTDGSAQVTVAFADPAHTELANALQRADPLLRGKARGVLDPLWSGRSVLFPRVGDAELDSLARGPTHLELLRAAGVQSWIGVPLTARGRHLGVLALATASSGRIYTDVDVALAEQLASRCGIAVDNARLYRATEDAVHHEEESLALLDTLLRGPDGMGVLNRELRWVKLNDALATVLGAPVERLMGSSILHAAGGYSASIRTLVQQVLETGEPLVDRELIGEPMGSPLQRQNHLISLYPVRNSAGELLGVGMIVIGITERKQASNEPRESEERHRRLVETANEGIWLIDTEGRTTFVNPRMAGMLGYEPAEIMGHSVMEFVENQQLHRERIGHNLAGTSEQLEFPFRHRDGSIVLALGGTSPVTNAQGEIVGALGMFSDITERNRAEAERDRLLTCERAARKEAEAAQRQLALLAGASELLASSLDYQATLHQIVWLAVPELADWCAVYLVESDETARLRAVAYANPAHAAIAQEWQRARLPLPGRMPRVLKTGRADLSSFTSDMCNEVQDARVPEGETQRQLRSIGVRSAIHVPMRARGRNLGVLALATAESGRRYESADVTLAQQLADRCAVALDNAVLVGDLRRALGVREELLAATSHELRTPLAHIKGFTSTLRQPDVEWDEAIRQDFLAEIERQADRLNALVGDLLTMSRLESGEPELHPRVALEPVALASAGVDRVRGLLGNAQLQVDVAPGLPPVVVDAAQLEQVVAYLVENAAKYGPSNAYIRVTAVRVEAELEMAVEDDGPGLPKEDLERVFDKFFRVQSSEQSGVPGTGLGLAICRAIVEAHGGRIWAENRPSGGARFVVRLPLEAPALPNTDDHGRSGDSRCRRRAPMRRYMGMNHIARGY